MTPRLAQETPAPLLVYDRIDANRRKTRLLLASFAVALLPIVSAGAVLVFPLIHLMYASVWPDAMRTLDLTSLLWLYGVFFLVSMVIVALVLVATTDLLVSNYGSRVILRLAHARPVDSGEEPDLVQVVENLCIGAGLPPPRIHVIESAAPNAFATGCNPDDASLVVTRGLLRLLDRREIEGVIAQELSHIGNHDIALSTTLAALIGAVSLPLKVLSAPLRVAFQLPWRLRVVIIATVLFALFNEDSLLMTWWTISGFIDAVQFYIPGAPHNSWTVYATFMPLYAVFVAPVIALFIREAVSRQRSFLADADAALLTRDPEALALALVKIAAVADDRLSVGEGTVHLYFVDPLSKSWLHVVFPSHPPVKKRVELLARMGNGIAPSVIQAARDAGARVQHDDGFTRLDDRPDAGSHVQPAVAADHTLTPLYEQPDGWSRVLAQLPESAVVIPIATEGHFIRVTTAEHRAGYVPRSAPLTALKNFEE